MKPIIENPSIRKSGYKLEDENIRYKLNNHYFHNISKPTSKTIKNLDKRSDDDNVRYMFPTVLSKPKRDDRKPKEKIKVNFWSTKQSNRLHNKDKSNRRHTVAITTEDTTVPKPKNSVKVRKQVSFLPSPLFSDNHIPMVTVPDDLTIQLNEQEANDLGEDLKHSPNNREITLKQAQSKINQKSPRCNKRKRDSLETEPRGYGNDHDLEFFSKYVVQKLRKMETNQRIYSENLINTVLMFGQLGKLNGKSKITD